LAQFSRRSGPALFLSLVALVAINSVWLFLSPRAPGDEVTSTIQIGNSRIDVVQDSGSLSVSHDDLMNWVRRAAEAVAVYYQHYPVPRVQLRIIPTDGRGVRGGKTFGTDYGGFIRIHVGSETTVAYLNSDWMLTHEMVHLTFPSVADNHHWIEEGIATYVEPIARVRAKQFDAAQMWKEVVRDLPQGLPAPGDEGLDRTHTWGRTYWGGALFCILADVQIHQQTANKKGLDDALRGILNAGGDIRQDWKLEKALEIGDKATGTGVLQALYAKMKDSPYEPDLAALWKQLGVVKDGDTVRFDDSAPLAATLKSITNGNASSSAAAAAHPPAATFAGRTSRSPR
jgi:hypothetical protein